MEEPSRSRFRATLLRPYGPVDILVSVAVGTLAACLALAAIALLWGCNADTRATVPSAFDLKPPALVEAEPRDGRSFVLRFDEEIEPVADSFAIDPGGIPAASAEGSELRLEFPQAQKAGAPYKLKGEVKDRGGNGARFALEFSGYNDRPAGLRITEVQTAKNSSTSRPHRDFVEFLVTRDGNLGGMSLDASSSVKTVSYVFPGVEVKAGDYLVLHCAPEGSAGELDESGSDLAAASGIDVSASRDLWSKAGPLPDATGVLILRLVAGGQPLDGLFYADSAKTGPLGDDRVGAAVAELGEAQLWVCAGTPSREDAFLWKPSVSRSILRLNPEAESGAGQWGLSESGGQSPGL